MYSLRKIDLAPEVHKQRRAMTAVVAPDEPVAKVLPHGGGQLPQGGLAGRQGLAPGLRPPSRSSAWAWLPRPRPHCGGGRTRRTCRPRPVPSSSGREDGDFPAPSGRGQARDGLWAGADLGDQER